MAKIEELHRYYLAEIKDKIFYERKGIEGKQYVVLYLHDAIKEIESFVDTFVQYFPYYVWNEDQLEMLDISINAKAALDNISRKCWSSQVVPKRTTWIFKRRIS